MAGQSIGSAGPVERIRSEVKQDWLAVKAVHEAAFGSPAEANLVAALRRQAEPFISPVAEKDGKVVGHIMFSPVVLTGHAGRKIMRLAPMAVAPEHQRKGIGSALVRAGLERCKEFGFGAVVVLGHPAFYPRFGFSPAANFGICCEYDVPDEALMLIELLRDFLKGASGKVEYHPAFKDL